jgi:MFS family permease
MLTVLGLPGLLRAFVPALMGRFSLAMVGLALLLAVQETTGSFAQAGFTAAAFGFANVIASPWRARAVDRWGQGIALSTMAAFHAAGLLGLAVIVTTGGAGSGWFIGLGTLIGLSAPPLGASMRVIWSSLTVPGDQRRKAFSLDAVSEDLLFVAGPVIITAVITTTSAGIGLVLTAVTALIGTAGMVLSRASCGLARTSGPLVRGDRPLRQPGFARVLLVLAGVGAVLGVVEIAAPAFAAGHGSVELSGWLLAAFAAGSALGGIAYGHLTPKMTLVKTLFVLCTGMGVLVSLVAWAPSVILLAGGLTLVGLFLGPSLITGYLLADHVVAESSRTEASAWINTTVNFGAAIASAIAGLVIDQSGPAASLFLIGCLALILASTTPFKRFSKLPDPAPSR